MAVRAAAGSAAPEAIWVPTLIATTCSTLTAVAGRSTCCAAGRATRRSLSPARGAAAPRARPRPTRRAEPALAAGRTQPAGPAPRACHRRRRAGAARRARARRAGRLAHAGAPRDVATQILQTWLFPVLIAGLLLVGVAGRVRVYEVDGRGSQGRPRSRGRASSRTWSRFWSPSRCSAPPARSTC